MRTIIVLLKRHVPSLGWVFVACLVLGLLGQIILLAQPQYGGALIQAAQEGANAFDPLIILLILLAASALLTMGQQVLIAKIGEGLAKRIRGRLSRSFFALSVLSQEARPSGWYSQRIVSDVELVKRLPGQLVSLVQSLFVFFGSFVALVLISPMTFVIGLGFGLLSLLFSVVASRPMSGYRKEVQELLLRITVKTQEFALTNRVLRSYNAWSSAEKSLGVEIEAAAKAGFKLSLLAGFLSPISSVLMQLANIGTILFASWQVAAGAMAFSDLVVFLMYFSYFSSSVSQFVGFISYAREAAVGDERIRDFEILVHPRSLPSSCHKEGGISPCPSFTFYRVSFCYPSSSNDSLNDASFSIPPGKVTALVGASGGGKSTCLGLMERFFSPSKGKILLDGIELSDIPLEEYRDSIGFIDQSASLISGTVEDNLRLAKLSASRFDMENALDSVGLGDIPLDRDVGERGLALSGGQRQRIALARTIIRNPKVLILDEPTSSLDGISEREVDCLLRSLFDGRTIVYAAHRLSSILSADWIVVLNEGKIEGQGMHHDLYESCLYYRRLIDSQSEI